MSESLKIISSRTALLILDYQLDTVRMFMSSSDAEDAIAQTGRLIEAARTAGAMVVYVTVAFRPGYPEINGANTAFLMAKQHGLLARGAPGTAIHPLLAPRDEDVVIIKHRVGIFHGTDLQTVLHAGGIDTLLLAGIHTSGVVLSAVRQAFDLDYRIIVAGDCCADPDSQVHDFLLRSLFPAQAVVSDTHGIITALARDDRT